jgi:hypothetical protein
MGIDSGNNSFKNLKNKVKTCPQLHSFSKGGERSRMKGAAFYMQIRGGFNGMEE